MAQSRKVIHRTPKQVYTKWLAALRSGKYKQTQDALRGKALRGKGQHGAVGFCCLGVLCDLAVKDGGGTGEGWSDNHIAFENEHDAIEYHRAAPPERMTNYLGITEDETQYLMAMNDIESRSFKYIARHIERSIMPKALARLKK